MSREGEAPAELWQVQPWVGGSPPLPSLSRAAVLPSTWSCGTLALKLMGLQKNEFLRRLHAGMDEGTFLKLTLGHPVNAADSTGSQALRKLLFRPVEIRGETQCAVVYRYATRDETRNLPFATALELIEAQLGSAFYSGHLFTQTEELQLQLGTAGKKDRLRILPQQRSPAVLNHDRSKSRLIDSKAPYLSILGVTDEAGKVRMGDKFRQIERFLDLLSSALRESGAGTEPEENEGMRKEKSLRLCDMGAGKGYLTFAAYDFLKRTTGISPSITGVEARPELVRLCNRVAAECGYERLEFVQSTIEQFSLSSLDILVALHACDTATDEAIAAGIRAGSSVLLVAPCCQKELRAQVDRTAGHGPLRDVLRHGIFAERHAEMATDALRALLLEQAGYRVRVCEFVAPEHTAKNIMIIATRRPGEGMMGGDQDSRRNDWDQRIEELKQFYGIKHHRLEQLLLEGRQLGSSSQPAQPVS